MFGLVVDQIRTNDPSIGRKLSCSCNTPLVDRLIDTCIEKQYEDNADREQCTVKRPVSTDELV